jgi:hypothetical protein
MIELTEEDRGRLKLVANRLNILTMGDAPDDVAFLRKLAERPAGDAEGLREVLENACAALRLIATVHWDEELGMLDELEEAAPKYIGGADWHAGDLFERKLVAQHGLPSGEYTAYLTGAGEKFVKRALAEALRVTQPQLFAALADSTEGQA